MSVGFVDPAYFETIRTGSDASVPEWARTAISDRADLVPAYIVLAAATEGDRLASIPPAFRTNSLATTFFSAANVRWCQERIVQKVQAITKRRIGLPDFDNVVSLITLVWNEALAISFIQIPRDPIVTISQMDRAVVQRACDDILIGIRAQSAYIKSVSEAPKYDDPTLDPTYVGGTKASAGTLSNSSMLPDAGTVQAFAPGQQPRVRLKAMDEPLY